MCGALFIAATDLGARDASALHEAPLLSGALAANIAQVITSNPRVKSARAAVEAARARHRAAGRPLYNPELGVDLQHAEDDSAALGLSQTFDWNDLQGAQSQVERFNLRAAQAQLALARRAAAAELIKRLAVYRTADEAERTARRRGKLMERFATLAEQRSRAGDLGRVELNLAHLALIEARLQHSQASLRRISADQAFSSLTGVSAKSWPTLQIARPLPDPHLREARYLTRLPAVRLWQLRVAAARAAVEVRSRLTRPNPTFSVRGGREDDSLLAGLSLSIPLYVRNNFSAEVAVANAELLRTQRKADNAFRIARARLAAATGRLRLTSAAWRNWQAVGRRNLRSQLRLLERLWRAGELSGSEYLVQTRQALDTRVSAMELRGELWQAWADWLHASGEIGRSLRWR
jgi:cobalt-zinc-cadmium efflux system outer membrane protein